jgi:hypothetical protein
VQKIGLGNVIKRLKGNAPRLDFYKYKHEDCANFDNRTCKVTHFTNVNPKETACPHFKAKQSPENEKK